MKLRKLSIALAMLSVMLVSSPARAAGVILGVLDTDPAHFATDTAAGLRLSEIDVNWAAAEPKQNSYSTTYLASLEAQVTEYVAAGWQISISPGFQSWPSWLLGLKDGQLVDQSGRGTGYPDYEFSKAVQAAQASYLKTLVTDLGSNVAYYRDGLSENGEMLYPDTYSNQWYAFSASAQCNDSSNLPSGVSCTPLKGWVPGTRTFNRRSITLAQVQGWYNWYEGALLSAEYAVVTDLHGDGFAGKIQLVTPGSGSSPMVVSTREAADLAPGTYDSYSTMNTGANWQALYGDASFHQASIGPDISSVYDGSGGNSECQPSDASDTVAKADPWVSGWSDTRWITYLAHANGFSWVVGENPGGNTAADLPGIFGLVQSCGLSALQWAWDDDLYAGGSNATLAEYVAAA